MHWHWCWRWCVYLCWLCFFDFFWLLCALPLTLLLLMLQSVLFEPFQALPSSWLPSLIQHVPWLPFLPLLPFLPWLSWLLPVSSSLLFRPLPLQPFLPCALPCSELPSSSWLPSLLSFLPSLIQHVPCEPSQPLLTFLPWPFVPSSWLLPLPSSLLPFLPCALLPLPSSPPILP